MANEKYGKSNTRTVWFVLGLAVIVIAGVWYWMQAEQSAHPAPETTMSPAPGFTFAPEGGVEVDLPDTPMTNTPADQPKADGADEEGAQ